MRYSKIDKRLKERPDYCRRRKCFGYPPKCENYIAVATDNPECIWFSSSTKKRKEVDKREKL